MLSTHQDFTSFENKVEEVMKILSVMSSENQTKTDTGAVATNQLLGIKKKETLEDVDIDNFLVKVNCDRTVINSIQPSLAEGVSQDKFEFMNSIEKDANRRAFERKQRESIAQELRKMGNQAFRNCEYEKAISMYSKAIDQVRDSPILYNNRALSYIRFSLYKRAIIDCDFVLNKLDEKNLRSWLYRAKANFLLQNQRNYEKCIVEAKKHHPKEINYIHKIVSEIEGLNESGKGEAVDDKGDENLKSVGTFREQLTK